MNPSSAISKCFTIQENPSKNAQAHNWLIGYWLGVICGCYIHIHEMMSVKYVTHPPDVDSRMVLTCLDVLPNSDSAGSEPSIDV